MPYTATPLEAALAITSDSEMRAVGHSATCAPANGLRITAA